MRKSRKRTFKRPFNFQPRLLVVSTGVMALLMVMVLFLNPSIGMADNGDFFREIHNIGLYYLTDSFDDRHFGYFNKFFGIRQFPFDENTIFVSSLSLMIRMALMLDLWVTQDNIFDLRMLAIWYVLLFLIAFYMLLKHATRAMTMPAAIAAAVVAILIFGDIGYIAYFNSFYGEPASYVLLLLTLALIFHLLRKNKPSLYGFIAFILCATLFVGAKQQNAPVGVLLAILCIRLLYIRKDLLWRVVVIGATSVMVIFSAFVYLSITDDIKHINQYHALTRGILENSKNPARDVQELGLDVKFSVLAGSTYYDKYRMEKAESEMMNKEFYSKYGYGSIIKYYVLHADRAIEKLDLAARHAYEIRPEIIGNYEKSAGKAAGQKTGIFTMWSSLKPILFPESFKFIVFFYVIYYGGLLKLYVTRFRSKDTKGMIGLEVFALIGVIGMMQFSVSFLGAGDADMAKHLFLFNVCFDWMFVSMVMYGLVLVQAKIPWKIWGSQKAGVYSWKQRSSISG
jgi:hypothetical protein